MAEYNGKKFYNFSMENDPDLVGSTWNTKNFEFSCVRPETVQRAIEKVNSDVGASIKQKKSHLLNKLREKCGDGENESQSYGNPDMHVEGCRAQMAPHLYNTFEFEKLNAKIEEIDDRQVKYTSDQSIPSYSGDDMKAQKAHKNKRTQGGESAADGRKLQKVVIEEFQLPQPAWVEISEPKTGTMQMFDLGRVQRPQQPSVSIPTATATATATPPPPPPPPVQAPPGAFGYPANLFPMPSYQYMPPTSLTMSALGYVYDQQRMMDNYIYQNPYGDYDPNAYLVEDSDLEDEMLRREHYTKFCEKRPEVNETLAAEENESYAEFVNIAPKEPYTDMSCLKSTVPMRYSELSEDEKDETNEQRIPKVVIKNRTQQQQPLLQQKQQQKRSDTIPSKTNVMQKNAIKKDAKKNKTSKPDAAFAKLLEQERLLSQSSQTKKTFIKKPVKRNITPPSPHARARPVNPHASQDEFPNEKELGNVNSMTINGKSVEQLKAEKVAIFNKMSRTHERLIDALQQLRYKLLEVHVPESTSDRQRRNRNGFEFSVRFLRNFLYPLKGMIDTVRNTSRDQFNSIKSNEACNRVAHIYSLFLQAVFTYSKQLRHFMIDQVPQKLTTLLEMLFSTTNMCLDKRLFDRNDAIVECLLNHCVQFLKFLEDLHAQRFLVARETCRKAVEEQQKTKFDLKMFMNDLNMYEPKVVPKRSSLTRQRGAARNISRTATSASASVPSAKSTAQASLPVLPKQIRKRFRYSKKSKQNGEKSDPSSNTSEANEPKGIEDDVVTQVQHWKQQNYDVEQQESQEIIHNLQEILQHTPNLDKYKRVDMVNRSLINALQNSRQRHTREFLQPLLKTIEGVIDMPTNDKKIENFLKAFQMKISMLSNGRKFQYEDKALSFSPIMEASENDFSSRHDGNEVILNSEYRYDSNHERSECASQKFRTENRTYFNGCSIYDDEENYEDEAVDNDNNNDTDDDDIDGQFYISGAKCSMPKSARSRKKKPEPLLEMLAAEVYTPRRGKATSKQKSRNSTSTGMTSKTLNHFHNASASHNSNKLSKKPKDPKDPKSNNKSARVQTPNSGKKTLSAKAKTGAIPPSPAQMRLKQQTQSSLIEGNKKVKLLRKCSHRNPMGSPPPAPTVSPSTSLANALPTKLDDLHISLGCSGSISKQSTTSISELSHQRMTFFDIELRPCRERKSISKTSIENQNSSDNYHTLSEDDETDDDEPTFRGTTSECPAAEPRNGSSNDENDKKTADNFKIKDQCYVDLKEMPGRRKPEETFHEYEMIASKNMELLIENEKRKEEEEEKEKEKKKEEETEKQKEAEAEKPSKGIFNEDNLLKQRDEFLSHCVSNRLYTNPNFVSPWKILSKLTNQLTREIVKDIETDFSSGVLKFVDDFLEVETRI